MMTIGKYNSYPANACNSASGKSLYVGSAYNAWTSGFFPGELWAMYEYLNDTYVSQIPIFHISHTHHNIPTHPTHHSFIFPSSHGDWLAAAEKWTAAIAPEQVRTPTANLFFLSTLLLRSIHVLSHPAGSPHTNSIMQNDTSTHDVGFMVFYSFGHGYQLTNNAAYKNVILNAAHSLSTRYSSIGMSV